MDEQDGTQAPALVRSANDDKEAWKVYWEAQGQPWRIEPEIDKKRQEELQARRTIAPDINQGIYPFKDIKLSRADVEWLLATHENGRGPVEWGNDVKWKRERRKRLDLRGADLRQVDLRNLPLTNIRGGIADHERGTATEEQCKMAAVLMDGTDLRWTYLEGAILSYAHMEEADLRWAHLEYTNLRWAYLKGASFRFAYLKGTHFRGADLRETNFSEAHLEGARLENVILSDEKHVGPKLADIQWGNVNLAVVKWSQVKMLGDESTARHKKSQGKVKERSTRLNEYEAAVRANRQLAVALQAQGMNEEAAYFAYHAQKLQLAVSAQRRNFVQYLFSLFLDAIAGYGYKPLRAVFWYLSVIISFATTYSIFGHLPLLPDTLVFSIMSFHGRGFFPSLSGETALHNPLVVLAAAEAVMGLLIEISFIATFTQRFFGK